MSAILESKIEAVKHDFGSSNKIINIENIGKDTKFFALGGVLCE